MSDQDVGERGRVEKRGRGQGVRSTSTNFAGESGSTAVLLREEENGWRTAGSGRKRVDVGWVLPHLARGRALDNPSNPGELEKEGATSSRATQRENSRASRADKKKFGGLRKGREEK